MISRAFHSCSPSWSGPPPPFQLTPAIWEDDGDRRGCNGRPPGGHLLRHGTINFSSLKSNGEMQLPHCRCKISSDFSYPPYPMIQFTSSLQESGQSTPFSMLPRS
uniref:Uncharacterized protein n=1 Tax=Leersia perrieri TaxID=77586 RepID=A0A0D9UWM3_9ORYZ